MGLRLLALACLAGAAFAGPYRRNDQNECAKECNTPSSPHFGWKEGRAYVYHVQSINNVTYTGGQTQKSSVEGTLEYHVISPCQVIIQMKNIRIDQKLSPEEKEDLKKKLELPLPVKRKDQELENVCPSPEESTQSLNIKKALISSFTNAMSSLETPEEVEELDSLGKCKTKCTPKKVGDGLIIKKEKDMKSCSNKHTLIAPLLQTKFPSSVLFENDRLVCEQYIEDKIIKRIECNETEKMKPPMKDQNSWFEFSGKLSMKYLETKRAENFQFSEERPLEDILYGIEESRKGDSNVKDVERILTEICHKKPNFIDNTVSNNFFKLGRLSKGLSYEELKRIFQSLKDGRICSSEKVKDLFVDALPMMGTEAAVELMVELIQNEEITGLKAKLFPASFALIRKPTNKMVSLTIPLVKADSSTPVMLGVSAMIHRICTRENCRGVDPVNQVVSILNEYIGEDCSSDEDDKTMAALKAFGNMAYHGESRKNIIKCISDKTKSTELRLAAIDAFRRINEKRPNEILDAYIDKDEDSEVRIACFASVFKQADHDQLLQIKRKAETEISAPVGAYVSSFIENMKQTKSPMKHKVKKLSQKLDIQSPKFDYRSNPKNIEMSRYSKGLNVGGGIELDIIQFPESPIPRSVSTRVDVDLFGKHVNLFEIGFREKGLRLIVEKMAGLKDSLSKQSSWDLFRPKHLMGDTDAALSLSLRLMETEIFDVSGSDLLGMGEMIKIGEMMNSLSQGEDADFSHSFAFMNTKLVIPSVTGRSYSIDFTGSSTVGVTAKSKADILSFPRNTDVHFHFQPSVNVEVSTTVGIQSSKNRPDVKVVSRMHLESDFEAKFHVKDGHVAKASLTLPSENVAMAKFSTDIVNIDASHSEKRIYDKRQKKVDHCFTKLHKPLGLSMCAVVEVPKPLVTRSFPYVVPLGSSEFVLKKSDDSFNSYEMHIEIPKRPGPEMRYKASLDTPGSKISRRFAVDVDVKQHKDHKQFSVELTSPFKTAGGIASYTKDDGLIQGLVNLHSDSQQLIFANVTWKVSASKSRMTYQATTVASFKDNDPLTVDGSVTVVRGRKVHLNYDFKMSQSEAPPVAIKGTITKEGHIELKSKSEWKLSTETSISSPIGAVKMSGTVDKKGKQLKAISTNVRVNYQMLGGKEYSATLYGTSQKSSRKIHTDAKFETTQYPDVNWHLTWDLQKESRENIKNNVTIKYGKNPDKNYIHFMQASRIPQPGHRENSAAIEIPQLNINHGVSVKHGLETGAIPKIKIDADLRYNQDKHVRGLIDMEYHSKGPLKASGKIQLEHPGGRYIYEDEIVQRSDNVIEGNPRFQYGEGKAIHYKYKYQRLSDDSKFHHEMESSLLTPSSPSPIESKASLKMNGESLDFAGHLGSKYSVQAVSNQDATQVHVKHPSLEGNLKVNNVISKKNITLDMKVLGNKPRQIHGSFVLEMSESKKGFHLEILPDINNKSESAKILASSFYEFLKKPSGAGYKSESRIKYYDFVELSLSESGDISPLGDQEFTLLYIGEGLNPLTVHFKRETGKEKANTLILAKIEDKNVAKFQLNSSWIQNANKKELSVNASFASAYRRLECLEVRMFQRVIRYGPSNTIQSHLSFKKNEESYKAEWNSDLQPNGVELNTLVQTPHENYEKQALGMSIQSSSNRISSSMNIEIPNRDVISIDTEIKKESHGFTATCRLTTSIEALKHILIKTTVDNEKNKKSVLSHMYVNDKKIIDAQASVRTSLKETEAEACVKISNVENYIVEEVSLGYRRTEHYISISGKIREKGSKEFSLDSEIKEEDSVISTTTTISTPYKNLKDVKMHISVENQPSKGSIICYVDANGERKGDAELGITSSSQDIEIKGRLKTIRCPEISAHVKSKKTGESFAVSAAIVKGNAPLFSTSFNRLSHSAGEKLSMETKSLEKTILDVEVSQDESRHNAKQFSLKVSGEFPALTVQFLKSNEDPTSVITQLRICKETHQTECYSLKSYHKNVLNSDNNIVDKHLTMDLIKSVGGSHSEAIGSFQVVENQDEHDYESKVIFQAKDKKVGYEMKLHKGQHQDDHHSLDAHIFLPQQTSRLRALVLHNSQLVKVEVDAIPNIEDETRKFGFDMRKYSHSQSKEVSGYIKMENPTRSEPFLFTYKLEPVDERFVKGRMLLHYSTTYGKTLNFEIHPNLEQESRGIRSMEYKLYTEDKSLDSHLKLSKQSSRQEDKIGCEWKYVSNGDEQTGGVIATLYDKKAGNPKSIKIKYYSPSEDYEVEGSIAQAPEKASISLASRDRKLNELRIFASDSCLNIEVDQSGPAMKSSLCVNQQEGNTMHLVKAKMDCHHKKCFDAGLYLDPQRPNFVSVALKWEKRDIVRSLRRVSGYDNFLRLPVTKMFREMKERIQEKLRRGIERIEEMKEEISRKMRRISHMNSEEADEYIQSSIRHFGRSIFMFVMDLLPIDYFSRQVVQPLREASRCFVQEYIQLVLEHIPQLLNLVLDVTRSQFEHCLKKFCVAGTFCHEFLRAYNQHGIQAAQSLVHKQISEALRFFHFKFPIITPFGLLHGGVDLIKKEIEGVFGKFIGDRIISQIGKFGKKIEMRIRQRAINFIDKIIDKINSIFNGDEDYRIAKSLASEAQRKLINVWRNKEEIAIRSLQAMKNDIKENAKRMFLERIQVQKYDPKEGDIQFSFRQPLGQSEVQILKNELRATKRDIKEYLKN